MATLRNWRTRPAARMLICFIAASLAWLQISPAYGLSVSARRAAAQREAWRVAHLPPVSLFPGLTQTPNATLQKKIAAKKAAETARLAADVRPLSLQEMQGAHGRGPYRYPYVSGAPMPWQRSFRDVNLCTGNLFKSFTDVQVAPARGAGLVLQRTYNSNDARVGPFGVGWTHAYDIRIQEADSVNAQSGNDADDSTDDVPRTDFFGHKHIYHRDADGLYTPPAYLYDEMKSDYNKSLVDGPPQVMDDTDTGMDGTIKHYINVVTKADGTSGNERACDYIQDRHGNTTTLTYGLSYVQPGGSTRKLLTEVTDPSGRKLTFHWTNLSTASQPAYRITQVDAPTDPATGKPVYRVVYAYYTDPASPNAANDLYNLKSVTLDPDGLNRVTTYTYTQVNDSYTGSSPQDLQGSAEYGLLASITDPLGHTISYTYMASSGQPAPGVYDVSRFSIIQVQESGGVASNGTPRLQTWTFGAQGGGPAGLGPGVVFRMVTNDGGSMLFSGSMMFFVVETDRFDRMTKLSRDVEYSQDIELSYDSASNVTSRYLYVSGDSHSGSYRYAHCESSTYGVHGNLLTSQVGSSSIFSDNPPFPGQQTATWYDASQYFKQSSATDMDGHTTAMGVGTSTDASVGSRGETLWVQDAGYNDLSSPSYHKQFTYTYNQYGQKTSETNLNGVVTQYTYGDQWGNLTQVVQDPGAGHLNRTTTMTYDVMGRVLRSTDPAGQTSTFVYNNLGQPKTVSTPAKGSTPAETISYAYDGNGRTHSVQDNRGTTVMAYEPGSDRVQSVTDPVTGTTSYTYDLFGSRTSMTLPGGGTWTYNYATSGDFGTNSEHPLTPDDNPDHMSEMLGSITDDQGRRVEYGTMPDGHVAWKSYTGIALSLSLRTDYTFDSAPYTGNPQPYGSHGWLSRTQTTLAGPVSSSTTYQYYSRLLAQNDYTYDNMGQRLSNKSSTQPLDTQSKPQVDSSNNPVLNARTETYAYDILSRLTAVDYGDGEKQGNPTNPVASPGYTFDAMGNRLTKSDSVTANGTTTTTTTASTFDAANRLLSVAQNGGSASAVTSDADGNTLTDTGGRTMTWDSQNRMTSCTKAGVTSTYTYGADGLRRTSTVNGVTTYYVYDGQTMIREMKRNTQNALVPVVTYLQGPQGGECRIEDTQQTEGYYRFDANNQPLKDAQGQPLIFRRGVTKWYIYDGLGSVVGEVDPAGSLTSSPKYDVYGAVRANSGTASSRQGFVGGLGHVSDTETGLVYMRARYYDPSNGRFASEDKKGDGNNWFVYCDNNPVNEVDRTGKAGEKLAIAILAEILGAVIGQLNNTPLSPALLQPYINAIDLISEMISTEALRVELVAMAGAKGDKGGSYKAAYNAVGYGAIGIMAGCALYQVHLIDQMIENDYEK